MKKDDSQIYITCSPDDYSLMELIDNWMCLNFFQLKTDRTELIIFGQSEDERKVNAYLSSKAFKNLEKSKSIQISGCHTYIKSITKSVFIAWKTFSSVQRLYECRRSGKNSFRRLSPAGYNGRLTALPKNTSGTCS